MKTRKPFLAIFILCFCVLFLTGSSPAEELSLFGITSDTFDISTLNDLDVSGISIGQIFLPAHSDTVSDYLALQLLALCNGHTAENTSLLFDSAGLEVLTQIHYDKLSEDFSHTCAFTIGKGEVRQNLMFRKNALFVVIRGTNEGEWYSNFECFPSRDSNSVFTENFLYCAEEVFLTLKDYIDQEEDPLVVVCGHSRGAACANLLGVLLDEYMLRDHVYVYTFACPATVREDAGFSSYNNIINYINPCDLIPRLPFQKWGLSRAGTDIILNCDEEELAEIESHYIDILSEIAPDIQTYYDTRYSLTDAGTSEDGLTPFETMLILCGSLTKFKIDDNNGIVIPEDLSSGLLQKRETKVSLLHEQSSLWPLIQIGTELSENEYSLAKEILHQHLPDIYLKLIGARLLEE